jgi:hypothetical protein
MNLFPSQLHRRRARRGEQALTLVEMVVTMAVFSMVLLAMVYGHLFGLKQDELVISKLGASDQSRNAFDRMTEDIRTAKVWQVGNVHGNGFSPIPNGSPQQGNAIQLSLTPDPEAYIRYYFDTSKGLLLRKTAVKERPEVIAEHLTNSMYFQAEDYRGNVQTDLSHKGVINAMLQFHQYQYPVTKVGPGNYYDYYKMEFRVTPHVPDGP